MFLNSQVTTFFKQKLKMSFMSPSKKKNREKIGDVSFFFNYC